MKIKNIRYLVSLVLLTLLSVNAAAHGDHLLGFDLAHSIEHGLWFIAVVAILAASYSLYRKSVKASDRH